MKYFLTLSAIVIFFWSACVSPPSYPLEPEIDFLSFSKDTINQLDTFSIRISFTDGDGDLGFQEFNAEECDPCDSSCFEHPTVSLLLIDGRTNCLGSFNLPFVPEKGNSRSISGEIYFVPSSVCCLPPSGLACAPDPDYPLDSITYFVQLIDRAGNLSNKLELPPVYVRCI
ncbi:MAG: hypothetical protein WD048_03655 [Chitinophagales bacterium]